jgi:hypothetical protein
VLAAVPSKGRLTIVTPATGLADTASAHFTRTPFMKRLASRHLIVVTDHQAVNWNNGMPTVKLSSVMPLSKSLVSISSAS